MRQNCLLLSLALSAATLLATTYSQPFSSGHGFTASQSGSCDSSYADADDTTNGNPANSVKTTCVGRNDSPTTTWSKALSWETMGVPAGDVVDTVDGKFDHAIIQRTHSSAPSRGPLQIYNSGNSATCMASDPEASASYSTGTGSTSWATQDSTGAVAPLGSCQTSSTTVTVRVGITPSTGNNAAATTQVNVDNLVLTIVSHLPSGGPKRVYTTTIFHAPLGTLEAEPMKTSAALTALLPRQRAAAPR